MPQPLRTMPQPTENAQASETPLNRLHVQGVRSTIVPRLPKNPLAESPGNMVKNYFQ